MALRDNATLFHAVKHEVFSLAAHAVGDNGIRGSDAHVVAARILDAIDRALTATGPAPGKCNRDVSCDNCGAKLHHGGAATGPGSGTCCKKGAKLAEDWVSRYKCPTHGWQDNLRAAPQTAPAEQCARCGNKDLERCTHGLCSGCTAADPCYFRGRHGPWNEPATPAL